MNNGVYLFCEWVENGVYHSGYKFFTYEVFQQLLENEY